MKYILPLLFVVFGFQLQAQSSQEAVQYLEQLSNGQKQISEQLMRYISASVHSGNASEVDRKRTRLIQSIEQVKSNVENSSDFNGDSSLRDAMLEYFTLNLITLQNEYKDIIELKEGANTDYDLMVQLLAKEEQANQQFIELQEQVETEVETFTSQYKINLVKEENPLSEMIEQSNNVTKHYNEIYLPLFKVNLQNIKLKEQLNGGSIDDIEAARKTTEEYAAESMAKINEVSPFNNDDILIQEAKKRIEFYVDEANVMGLNSIELNKLETDLEAKKAVLEKKKPKERTKEMVDEYNSLVGEVNQLAQQLNQHANQFNISSQKEFMAWQQIVQEFREKHIPKYGMNESYS